MPPLPQPGTVSPSWPIWLPISRRRSRDAYAGGAVPYASFVCAATLAGTRSDTDQAGARCDTVSASVGGDAASMKACQKHCCLTCLDTVRIMAKCAMATYGGAYKVCHVGESFSKREPKRLPYTYDFCRLKVLERRPEEIERARPRFLRYQMPSFSDGSYYSAANNDRAGDGDADSLG